MVKAKTEEILKLDQTPDPQFLRIIELGYFVRKHLQLIVISESESATTQPIGMQSYFSPTGFRQLLGY